MMSSGLSSGKANINEVKLDGCASRQFKRHVTASFHTYPSSERGKEGDDSDEMYGIQASIYIPANGTAQ
jgi:hypothetical protein